MASLINQTPEQRARDRIDRKLIAAGWVIQDKKAINLNAGPGVAVREYQTDAGPADYVLFVERQAVGVIEAKPEAWGHKISMVEDQADGYANAKLKWIKNEEPLPFVYQSTGEVTRFTNGRDPAPRSREIFHFPRPEELVRWCERLKDNQGTLREGLRQLPSLNTDGLRDCQIKAITKLEASFKDDRPRALVQMATGSGKTYTAITAAYRLLKYAKAKRILFLVDTKNLGEQAEQEFMAYLPNDDNRKFNELYTVQRLKSSYVASDSQVCISTIQRMYSLLKGEELDEATIYNLWRQVIEYFDAYLIGLTATPDNRTYGFFKKNVVSEYDHEKAVADGVNVGNEVYLIETKKTQSGGVIEAKQQVGKRERLTRKHRWETQDEDEAYSGKQLDRDIVNPDQIRTVIRTFKDQLSEIFPGRQEVPKTLIFAKTDSHADDIIHTVREEFGESNAFCKKITHNADDPKSVLSQFRNDYHPRIAVTVDMIATGTDVRPLECLLFMRDVKSKNYFEQMKGRGTRTLDADGLKKVTPSANSAKTHYVIVDAIGVTQSLKTASQPLITKPGISLKELAMGVMMGAARDEDSVSSLAGRLARLDKQLDDKDRARISEKAGGTPLTLIVGELLNAINPDVVEQKACEIAQIPVNGNPGDDARDKARDQLVGEAAKVFNGELIELINTIRREKEQTIVVEDLDEVLKAEWAGETRANAEALVQDFADYLNQHRDQIEALTIYFQTPARRSEVTFDMIKTLLDALQQDRPKLAPLRVWQAYAHLDNYRGDNPISDLAALVALIRRVTEIDQTITPFAATVKENFKRWIFQRHSGAGEKFNEEQMTWLTLIRDHITSSFHLERDDLEMAPFDSKGGLGRMYQLFGDQMDGVIDELNRELVA